MMKFLRNNVYAAGILTVLRLYLGWQWMTAGWGKVKNGFDASGYLQGAIAKASGEAPTVKAWWATFLEGFALPNVELFNILVAWGELLVGLGLILGCFTVFAALMGAVMNFAFLFSGTISSNPEMIIMAMFILTAGANAGKFGLDYYIMPTIRKVMKWELNKGEEQIV